ncbi:MAG: MBL fold metallo-hydrolase [Rhodocyclales bacterium]|nr:MBL fold metallo-hydrolase [Rhodocyclales bacterium]
MRFASLGSGSRGNALVVEAGRTRILLDCGFGPRELARRLARAGLAPGDLDAILVTHEHADHVGGVAACARRYAIDVFLTHGTLGAAPLADVSVEVIDGHTPFAIGDIEVLPFPVPHDAREPTQFVFADGARQLGVLTDAGCVTPHMVEMLSGCAALVIECNHDAAMLAAGRYPPHLKRRIAGRFGHLDNAAAADLLARVDRSRLRHVVAAHLSQENNTPALAMAALAAVLDCAPDWLAVADQDSGCDWRQLG